MSDLATERYAAAAAPASLRRVQSFLNTCSTGRPPEADRATGSGSQPDLGRHLEKLRWGMTLKDGRLSLVPEGEGWHQVAGTVLGDILVAQEHELWPRLKACRNPPCSVVFYDSSKNQSRVWHNTSDCGNLVNLRAARARQREQVS